MLVTKPSSVAHTALWVTNLQKWLKNYFFELFKGVHFAPNAPLYLSLFLHYILLRKKSVDVHEVWVGFRKSSGILAGFFTVNWHQVLLRFFLGSFIFYG